MNTNKPPAKPVELELVAIDPPPADPSRDAGAPMQPAKSLGITNADMFLEEAAREYQSGKIDKALWARTLAVAGDDESLAIAGYLRARAVALEQERRNARAARLQGPSTGAPGSQAEGPPTATRGSRLQGPATRTREQAAAAARAPGGPAAPRPGRSGVPRNVMYVGAAAAALSFVAVFLWVLAAPHQTESARQVVNAAVNRSGAPRVAAVQPPAVNAVEPAPDPGAGPSLADKVKDMKREGNWNVLVLNAAEWTRKEPANGAAWRELGQGYANLRQYDEALDAATRAVSLAPGDGEAWNGLGRIHVALERWRDAGAAFDKALAVRADDPDALCGASVVARREGRPKDAEAIARRMNADVGCKGFGESQSVAVTPRTAPARY
jgi:tetratricopeptide (TPR) repeat protein